MRHGHCTPCVACACLLIGRVPAPQPSAHTSFAAVYLNLKEKFLQSCMLIACHHVFKLFTASWSRLHEPGTARPAPCPLPALR